MALNKKSWRWAKHQKRWFGKWHTYVGIIAGAVLAFVGLTGSILVFQDDIDRTLNPEFFEVFAQQKKMPLANLVEIVKRENPKLKFDYVMAGKNDSPVEAYSFYNFKTEEQFFVNQYTGKLSGKRLYESSFIHIVTDLHTTLLVPTVGKYIVGLASLCLMILTISGLRLWLPKKWKELKAALSIKFSGKFKRQNYDWHNVIGLYTSPIVILISLTGFCITFSQPVIALLFIFSGKSPAEMQQIFAAKSLYEKNISALPLKQLIAKVERQVPNTHIGGLAFPADKFGTYRFDMVSKALPKGGKREMFIVDQYSGKILTNSRKDFPDIGEAYLAWLTPIHYGSFGGLPTQILALIGSLTPLALFITGFIIWWPRYKKRKAKSSKIKDKILESASDNQNDLKPGKVSLYKTFTKNLKDGFKYAGIFLPLTFLAGALYGLISGIIIQPAVFAVAFFTIMVAMNFIIAMLVEIPNLLILTPLKRGKRGITRYFALSFSFFVIYLVAYLLLLNTGLDIF